LFYVEKLQIFNMIHCCIVLGQLVCCYKWHCSRWNW